MIRDGSTYWYCQSPIVGNVSALLDSSGNIQEGYKYRAYGEATVLTGPGDDEAWFTADDVTETKSALANPYMFTGRRYDSETGLYYFRFRIYDPIRGRFLARDPGRVSRPVAGDRVYLTSRMIILVGPDKMADHILSEHAFSRTMIQQQMLHDIMAPHHRFGNSYEYCLNRSQLFIDPFGLQASTRDGCCADFETQYQDVTAFYCDEYSAVPRWICKRFMSLLVKMMAKSAKCRIEQENCRNRCGVRYAEHEDPDCLPMCFGDCAANYMNCLLK